MLRIVADLGNYPAQVGPRLAEDGRLTPSIALPPGRPAGLGRALGRLAFEAGEPSRVGHRLGQSARSRSVWPPSSGGRGVRQATWYRDGGRRADRHGRGGRRDRRGRPGPRRPRGRGHMPPGRPGLIVSCGTAITIERVSAAGVWQGGVIAPGLFLGARALHLLTAQLPLIHPDQSAPSWGRGTLGSLEAGIFWGTVGAVRELLARQAFDGRRSTLGRLDRRRRRAPGPTRLRRRQPGSFPTSCFRGWSGRLTEPHWI